MPVVAQDQGDDETEAMLQRIEDYVEGYFARAQRLVSEVRVHSRPMRRDMSRLGPTRRLLYTAQVEWEPETDDTPVAPIVRFDLVEVDGRLAAVDDDDLECSDPKLVSPEPLAMFLSSRRGGFTFDWAGSDNEAGRRAVMLDYRSTGEQPPTVEWNGPCASVDLPGLTRGRVWVDPVTGAVLRLDERLTGMFDFEVPPELRRTGGPRTMTIERADASIRYRTVEFSDPLETLLLPTSIETLTVLRNAAVPRLLVTQEISNYRRFTTASRIINDPPSQ